MDGKHIGKSKTDYEKLKTKYHEKIHGNIRQGRQSKVVFIETERCIELWFLYHFTPSPITREFNSYKDLEKNYTHIDLNMKKQKNISKILLIYTKS